MGENAEHRKPNGRGVLVLGLLLTFVASAASAVSAWASLQALNQAQQSELLEKRVDACFELRQRAANQLGVALRTLQTAPFTEYDWGYSDVFTYDGYDWYGDTKFSTARPPCTGNASQIAGCESKRKVEDVARAQELRQRAETRASAAQEAARLQFEAARVFDILASPELAAAETKLSVALNELSKVSADYAALSKEGRPSLTAATQAFNDFSDACIKAVDPYRQPSAS